MIMSKEKGQFIESGIPEVAGSEELLAGLQEMGLGLMIPPHTEKVTLVLERNKPIVMFTESNPLFINVDKEI